MWCGAGRCAGVTVDGREWARGTRSGEGDVRDRNYLLRRRTAVHTARHTVERVGVVVVLRGVWCCDSLTLCQRKKLRVASRYEGSCSQLGAGRAEERLRLACRTRST